MKIPNSVTIGNLTIKIVYVDNLLPDRDSWGEFSSKAQEIRISSGISEERVFETFFHELIEAINSIYDKKMDHDCIQTIAVALAQTMEKI